MSAAISIEAKLLKARRAGVDLHPTTLRLAPGRHALVGRQEDGAALLLACMAGEVRLKGGELTVLGGSPRDPKVRARVGFVPLGLVLPDVLRVDETLTLARHIRGEDAADKSVALALAALGIETLARRRVHTLDPSEVRAVALAEVLASKAVSVVLIEEPFATMAAPAAAALPRVLAAQSGKCIVVSTASANDASRVASDFALFDRGRLLRIVPEAPLRETHEVPRMHVLCQDARALAAALAKKPEVAELELLGDGVVVSGKDLALLAAAVNAAIVDTGVEVQRIEPEPASLEALRADALAELAQRTAVAAAVGRP
jgi:ABC-type multidrug transport system ATPase subunit